MGLPRRLNQSKASEISRSEPTCHVIWFTVPNGARTVTLKFAELYYTVNGARRFNIAINGVTVATNYDPRAAAGATFRATDLTFNVNVTTGQMVIQFTPVTGEPCVNAIQIQ